MAFQLDPQDPVFPISVAARLSGLSQKQLRLLEARELVVPRRVDRSHGLYSVADIQRLRYIAHLSVGRKVNIAGVRVAIELLDKLPPEERERVVAAAETPPTPTEPDDEEWAETLDDQPFSDAESSDA